MHFDLSLNLLLNVTRKNLEKLRETREKKIKQSEKVLLLGVSLVHYLSLPLSNRKFYDSFCNFCFQIDCIFVNYKIFIVCISIQKANKAMVPPRKKSK